MVIIYYLTSWLSIYLKSQQMMESQADLFLYVYMPFITVVLIRCSFILERRKKHKTCLSAARMVNGLRHTRTLVKCSLRCQETIRGPTRHVPSEGTEGNAPYNTINLENSKIKLLPLQSNCEARFVPPPGHFLQLHAWALLFPVSILRKLSVDTLLYVLVTA